MALLVIAFLLVVPAARLSAQTAPAPAAPAPAAPAPAQPSQPPASSDYIVGPQDVLNIIVYGEPAPLTGRFRVDNDGTFPYQYLNRVKAEGLTVAAIEDALEKALGDGYLRNPQVSVEVAVYRSQNVYVQGQVRSPGKYPLPSNASLMDAIFLAGSTLPEAGNWVEIYHQAGSRRARTRLSVGHEGARHPHTADRRAERQGASSFASRTATRFSCRKPSAFT